MSAFGLFSGIGGFELSLANHGVDCIGLCDIDPVAQSVLRSRFAGVPVHSDVASLREFPSGTRVVTAGFPCQDLSQAGSKTGIGGSRSKLVDHVFRLIRNSKVRPDWVILENVSYMLRLNKGEAMEHVLKSAEKLGYRWAYRVLDARAFGLPQRRERVIIVLSRAGRPEDSLFPNKYVEPDVDDTVGPVDLKSLYGFYWTEGKRGLGWVKNAVPTIKGGSGLGIPSPPAIWIPKSGKFGTPSIEDAERMFGFPADWTKPAEMVSSKAGARWKLVGNTICVPMVDWVVNQLLEPQGLRGEIRPLRVGDRLPLAAFGFKQERTAVIASTWPLAVSSPALATFLQYELKPLSVRAAAGFYSRALESSTIRFADGFLPSMKRYIKEETKRRSVAA